MNVGPDTSIRQRTVSDHAIWAKLRGTPMEGAEGPLRALVEAYRIDPNWALSYLQWESGFGSSAIGRANPSNPWDILCYPGQWGQVAEYRPGNGYCYAVYPDLATGLEAGFRLWSSYADSGWSTWFASLSRALCGVPSGCDSPWVANVIATGQANAAQWPAGGSSDPAGPPGLPRFSPLMLGALVGLGLFMAGSGD